MTIDERANKLAELIKEFPDMSRRDLFQQIKVTLTEAVKEERRTAATKVLAYPCNRTRAAALAILYGTETKDELKRPLLSPAAIFTQEVRE